MGANHSEAAACAFKEELDRLLAASPEIKLGDPAAAGRRGALYAAARGLWESHLDGLLSAEETRELLGFKSRSSVRNLVRRRRLLRLESGAGRPLYPLVQFDRNGRPFEVLDRVLDEFDQTSVSTWTAASFLASPQRMLDGETPRNWLIRGGDPERVVEAARRIAARLAR